jgi:hypothetical protein
MRDASSALISSRIIEAFFISEENHLRLRVRPFLIGDYVSVRQQAIATSSRLLISSSPKPNRR